MTQVTAVEPDFLLVFFFFGVNIVQFIPAAQWSAKHNEYFMANGGCACGLWTGRLSGPLQIKCTQYIHDVDMYTVNRHDPHSHSHTGHTHSTSTVLLSLATSTTTTTSTVVLQSTVLVQLHLHYSTTSTSSSSLWVLGGFFMGTGA